MLNLYMFRRHLKLFTLCSVFGIASFSNSEVNYPEFIAYYVKYSGLFDRHIRPDYSVVECVHFLNKNGIKVNWLDIHQNKPVDQRVMARITAQTFLMLNGEKKAGSTYTLPEGFQTWEQFCEIHGLDYKKSYNNLLIIFNKL